MFCVLRFAFCILPFAFCVLRFASCVLRFACCVLRFVFCVVRFALCVLRFAVCGLRFAFCLLRFAFCVLRLSFCVLRFAVCGLRFAVCRYIEIALEIECHKHSFSDMLLKLTDRTHRDVEQELLAGRPRFWGKIPLGILKSAWSNQTLAFSVGKCLCLGTRNLWRAANLKNLMGKPKMGWIFERDRLGIFKIYRGRPISRKKVRFCQCFALHFFRIVFS